MPSLGELVMAARLAGSLPAYLRRPLTLPEARAALSARLARRDADFLAFARRAIYAVPASPYRRLLLGAGCAPGDLDALVRREGIERALDILARTGVYLTVDEFKGRRAVTRGGTSFTVHPADLLNPHSRGHVMGRTGGSRGTRAIVPIDLAFIRDRSINTGLAIDAWGGRTWVQANWEIPGGSALGRLLWLSRFGNRPVRWFSQVDPASPGLDRRYRWSAELVRGLSVLAGAPLPRPEFVPPSDPGPIIRWMRAQLDTGRTPLLHTFPSAAVRVCRAARDAGVSLDGARFAVVGEPVTAARVAAVRSAGAEAIAVYGSAEAGRIGYGCPAADDTPDEVHVMHDLVGLAQPWIDTPREGMPPGALLVSSLRPSAPIVMLNVSLGDEGERRARACGCPMQALGWTTQLRGMRSYEKLTAGGMTFLDHDVARVLEETLPARFGGGPTDYQLVEDEAVEGQPRIRLLVHPAIGPLDAGAVAGVFLDALGRDTGPGGLMALQWREAGVVTVERRPPLLTGPGKILHLVAAQSVRADR